MDDESALLLGLLGDNFDPSLTTDFFKNGEIDFTSEFDVQDCISEPASSETLDTHLDSPRCNTLQVNSPEFFPVHSPASPYSDISESVEESSYSVQSPASSVASDASSSNTPQVKVSVCDNVASPSCSVPVLGLDEVSRSVRKRKFVSDGGTKPKVIKVVMYPKRKPPKSNDTYERKKVQNKEAAARYRVKKRMEDKVLSDEVDDLESEQNMLRAKHDELQKEIKYLKSLMCEILVKKGVMK